MRIALLEELQHLVGFDAYAWLLTDPETEVGCAPLADVPGLPLSRLPELIRLKYLTSVNRWTGLAAGAVTLQSATRGEPSWSLAWRELLVEYRVTDVASLVFRDRFGCWGWLDLWRTGPGRNFTEAETTLLAALTSPICDALRRCQAGTFKLDGSEGAQPGPVVLVLSPELTVRGDRNGAPRACAHGVYGFDSGGIRQNAGRGEARSRCRGRVSVPPRSLRLRGRSASARGRRVVDGLRVHSGNASPGGPVRRPHRGLREGPDGERLGSAAAPGATGPRGGGGLRRRVRRIRADDGRPPRCLAAGADVEGHQRSDGDPAGVGERGAPR